MTTPRTVAEEAILIDRYVRRRTSYQRAGWVELSGGAGTIRAFRAEMPLACEFPGCQRMIAPGEMFTHWPPAPGRAQPRCRVCTPFCVVGGE